MADHDRLKKALENVISKQTPVPLHVIWNSFAEIFGAQVIDVVPEHDRENVYQEACNYLRTIIFAKAHHDA